ncbi:hypothetical protein WN51_14365 [Melipona quadrifasciata]|uniref:Uncharacterized protein n=1 Tax=Melipona quadrifasciata TaxID=166423 RepID=A0A0M9A0H7_9HYME|nr:hypothetical protein WN51_14365 [Melipona quadrifasciata]
MLRRSIKGPIFFLSTRNRARRNKKPFCVGVQPKFLRYCKSKKQRTKPTEIS